MPAGHLPEPGVPAAQRRERMVDAGCSTGSGAEGRVDEGRLGHELPGGHWEARADRWRR